ncbi:hypothetical protein C0995_003587 [Termitomyces sp. Mi166|nr:hypothetical protein C0995_003587 [Termitomyces sp. Mi166\
MSTVLNAFKLKPYDLEPVFATWTNGPIFEGNPKKDMPVDGWLEKIQAGCEERKIPEEYWYKVAQHFMGPRAKARYICKSNLGHSTEESRDLDRLDELKAVIIKIHGGKYRWSWKKFKVAMQSMGWGIDATQKETVQVSKTTGSWWIRRKVNKDMTPSTNDGQHPTLSRSTSFGGKKGSDELPPGNKSSGGVTEISLRFWPIRRNGQDYTPGRPPLPPKANSETADYPPRQPIRRNGEDYTPGRPPLPPKANSEMAVVTTRQTTPGRSRSNTVDSGNTTTIEAPLWLLNACNALEYITSEHPKTMSIISAILITAGSIPAIPAISAGAGGAVLASGAAHAIGAIAVGLGQALSMSVKSQTQDQNNQVQAPSTSR